MQGNDSGKKRGVGHMLTEEQILERLKLSGALLRGHFRLPSGKHTDQYVECARVLQYPWHATVLCQELASRFKNTKVDMIVGPALGGIIIAYELGRIMEIPTIFTERNQGIMSLCRGFSIRLGQRVVIAEDEIITGRSIKEVMSLITSQGGEIVGIAALIDRSGEISKNLGYRVEALITLKEARYSPEECPWCRQDIPLSRPRERSF